MLLVKFNNLELTLGMVLTFYISVAKGLKLKVRELWGLIPTFVEVTVEKLVGGLSGPSILNRVKLSSYDSCLVLLSCVCSKSNLDLHCLFQFLHLL